MSGKSRGDTGGKIVSSAHLADGGAPTLSEFEFGLIISGNAFDRWIVRCMAAAGYPELGPLDILVLHSVNHRDRAKRLSDICFVLNIEDSHTVNYALKKLEKLALITRSRRGKETLYATSVAGTAACLKYRELREDCLVTAFEALAGGQGGDVRSQINETAELLRVLSGLYDQAARAAASL